MMPGGETMALQSNNSFGLGGGFGGFGNMMPGVMLPPRFMSSLPPMQLHNDNIFTSDLSLAPSCDVEERLLDGGQIEENEHLFVKPKEDESDSKSSSDNLEGGSGDDNEGADPRPAKKKRYHRHTLHQIQEMERFFKECPHPDKKQRQELSRELKLSRRQIKFWFQNKRTKLKIDRITAMAAKYIGRQVQSMPLASGCSALGSSALDGLHSPLPLLGASHKLTTATDMMVLPFALSDVEKPLVIELVVASMDELLQVAQAGEPLWVMDAATGAEVIQQEAYLQRFPRGIGPTPPGLKSETTRHTGSVIMNSTSLVEALMDVNRWAEMFPSIVSRVQTVEVLSTGIAGTYDGAVQLMYAEFHVPSPLVFPPVKTTSCAIQNAWIICGWSWMFQLIACVATLLHQ